MIGIYDYTVILTYLSLASSVSGMFLACSGHIRWALACLALSGLLDAFDGKVARTKKGRTRQAKDFGVQIDSLCDIVCFGVLPVIICFHLGMCGIWGMAVLTLYCLAGLIRLAWFNVTTGQEPSRDDGKKYYQGLPITSIAVILPVFYSLGNANAPWFIPVLHAVIAITGLLFVLRFPFRKPTTAELLMLIVVVGAVMLYVLLRRSNLPWQLVLRWKKTS